MTDCERYLKLKGERDELQSRLTGIPGEISRLSVELGPMNDAAVRAEIQGDKHAPDKRQEIDKAKAAISALSAEKAEKVHRVKVMGDLQGEYRSKAAAELAGIHDKAFRKAVKEFAAALKAAQKAEQELVAVFNAAHTAFGEVDSPSPLPGWEPQFVRGCQDAELNQKVLAFLDRWTAQGYDVSK